MGCLPWVDKDHYPIQSYRVELDPNLPQSMDVYKKGYVWEEGPSAVLLCLSDNSFSYNIPNIDRIAELLCEDNTSQDARELFPGLSWDIPSGYVVAREDITYPYFRILRDPNGLYLFQEIASKALFGKETKRFETSIEQYPTQSTEFFPIGCRVKVCFRYDADNCIGGVVVRNDSSEPYLEIFGLDDGRYVLASECQYTNES